MLAWKVWTMIWLLCLHSTLQREVDNDNELNHQLRGVIQWKYDKRPFCNAFTGCGKKRSSLPYPLWKRTELDDVKAYNNDDDMSEGLSDLIDINAEPAVENVQKQIMSQAKIFEAIKEASKEIFRQKNMQKLRQREANPEAVEGV
ncbi:cardioactive peptide isoform X1 [Zeugodacus cucurbitae]|uniref:cardioactive peptide isoform X1 n=1 Tax=Zeugodacus cucurbitae TaxID=28588 RepID=UPI0005968735|nr:cardioactive peptide isoform X1 [Zeugodacus cucurbitae]